jgi:hypothetical protein
MQEPVIFPLLDFGAVSKDYKDTAAASYLTFHADLQPKKLPQIHYPKLKKTDKMQLPKVALLALFYASVSMAQPRCGWIVGVSLHLRT